MVNNSGTLVTHVKYNSFGEPIGGTAPVAGFLFGFDGMPWDPSASQYEAGAVPYDPSTGQRLRQDPIGFASGTTNLTAWCGNDPTGLTDPTGEDAYAGLAGSGNAGSDANVAHYLGDEGVQEAVQQDTAVGLPNARSGSGGTQITAETAQDLTRSQQVNAWYGAMSQEDRDAWNYCAASTSTEV